MLNDHEHPLGARLRYAGAALRAELAPDELADRIVARLQDPVRRRTVFSRRAFRIASFALTGVVASAGAAWATSSMLFDSGATTVREGRPPGPVTTRLVLGHRVDRASVARLPMFIAPHAPWLVGEPQWWIDPRYPEQLSLTYAPTKELPEIAHTGVGLLVQSFNDDGSEVIRKYVRLPLTIVRLELFGRPALYLANGDDAVFYVTREGTHTRTASRLSGPVLLFQRGSTTVRIEGELSRDRLVQLANSIART